MSAPIRFAKWPVENASIRSAVETLPGSRESSSGSPALRRGGDLRGRRTRRRSGRAELAGAWRMSSMLWIGVIPQIASFEKGQPYASAPTSFPST